MADTPVLPPRAKIVPHVTEIHGVKLEDPYHWLRKRDDPEVMAYLEAENAYTDRMTADTGRLQQRLFAEMVGYIKEDDSSVPYFDGGYWYYTRTIKGADYSLFCRRKGTMEAAEELILDCNELARGLPYFQLGVCEVSPDQKYLAYSFDEDGSEHFSLYIKDLETGANLAWNATGTSCSAEWAEDSRTLFYTTLDELVRPYRLMRHRVGDDSASDDIVFQEEDGGLFVSISKSRSKRFLFLGLTGNNMTEFHYLEAADPLGSFSLFYERREDIRYYPEHNEDVFLIITNEDAKDFKLVTVPIDDTGKDRQRVLIAHEKGVRLEQVLPFRYHLVVFALEHGLDTISVLDLRTGVHFDVEMPDSVYDVEPGDNPDYYSETLRFEYSSPITPASVFEYDLCSRERRLLKQKEIPSGHNPSDYKTERIWAPAGDGTKIPVTVAYRADLKFDGTAPCLLTGYGSYGYPIEPGFRSTILAFLERGVVFAIAHIRGGGMLGESWYEQGKLLNKKNSFSDFIAAAEHLIKEGYTSSGRLAIKGGSAGGLLIGAVINERPDLFHTAVAEVPFVDVINTMLDESIPLTVAEFTEWGNPKEAEYFEYMYSYSPYDQVKEQEYPNLLVMAGLNDPRVQYWEPAKWVARLRSRAVGNNLLLLKTNMGAGHGGASGRYEYLKEYAFVYAFILRQLGVA